MVSLFKMNDFNDNSLKININKILKLLSAFSYKKTIYLF